MRRQPLERAFWMSLTLGGLVAGCGDSSTPLMDGGADAPPDAAPDAGPGLCETGLSAWYRFEDSSGPVLDACGRHPGTSEGAGLQRGVAGRMGNGVHFDGTDGRIVIRSAASLDFMTAGTIQFWLKLADKNSVGSTVSRGTGNVDDNVLQTTDCGNVVTIYTKDMAAAVVASDCDALSTSDWAHVTVVNDGAQTRLYLDGTLTKTSTGGFLGPLPHDLYLGRRQQGEFPLNGSLDELKWWTVARGAPQICTDAGGTWQGASCAR